MPLLHSTLGLFVGFGDSRSASELMQLGNLSQAVSPQAHSRWWGSGTGTDASGDTQIRWISSLGLGNCTWLLLASVCGTAPLGEGSDRDSEPLSLLVSPTGAKLRHQHIQILGHAAQCRTSSCCTRSFCSSGVAGSPRIVGGRGDSLVLLSHWPQKLPVNVDVLHTPPY